MAFFTSNGSLPAARAVLTCLSADGVSLDVDRAEDRNRIVTLLRRRGAHEHPEPVLILVRLGKVDGGHVGEAPHAVIFERDDLCIATVDRLVPLAVLRILPVVVERARVPAEVEGELAVFR